MMKSKHAEEAKELVMRRTRPGSAPPSRRTEDDQENSPPNDDDLRPVTARVSVHPETTRTPTHQRMAPAPPTTPGTEDTLTPFTTDDEYEPDHMPMPQRVDAPPHQMPHQHQQQQQQ